MLDRLVCLLIRQHDYALREGEGRVFLRCRRCGARTPGWEMSERLRVSPRGSKPAVPTLAQTEVRASPPELPRPEPVPVPSALRLSLAEPSPAPASETATSASAPLPPLRILLAEPTSEPVVDVTLSEPPPPPPDFRLNLDL